MNVYKVLEEAITSDCIEAKEKRTQQCFEYCSKNEFISSKGFEPLRFDAPSYASRCEIVHPKSLKTCKDFDKPQGLATLVHAIAHIEYSAIDLALDTIKCWMVYFKNWALSMGIFLYIVDFSMRLFIQLITF